MVLIGLCFGEEFAATGEVSRSKNSSSTRRCTIFHIALIGVRRRPDAEMLAIAQRGREAGLMTERIVAADEFAAVVGLPSQIAQVDAPTIPRSAAECEPRRRRWPPPSVSRRRPRTADRCELPWPCLRPGASGSWAWGQNCGISHRSLVSAEICWNRRQGRFHGGQILLALIFLSAFARSIRVRARCAGWPCAKR